MVRWFLTYALAIVLAVLLSQFPEFRQQYVQRLGGALDEVTHQVEALDARATAQGMERYDYVRHLLGVDDTVVHSEGQALEALLARQVRLRTALAKIASAPPYASFPVMLLYLDTRTARGTVEAFRPALPLSIEGAAYALSGYVAGLLIVMAIGGLLPRRVPVEVR